MARTTGRDLGKTESMELGHESDGKGQQDLKMTQVWRVSGQRGGWCHQVEEHFRWKVMNPKCLFNNQLERMRCWRHLHLRHLRQGGCLLIWALGARLLAPGGEQLYLVYLHLRQTRASCRRQPLLHPFLSIRDRWTTWARPVHVLETGL